MEGQRMLGLFTNLSRESSTAPLLLPAGRRMQKRRRVVLERLEDRTLLATLDINDGALTYAAAANVANNLTISTTGTAIGVTARAEEAPFWLDRPPGLLSSSARTDTPKPER